MGTNIIIQSTTQSAIRGEFVSSLGPELFMEMIRANAQVFDNHCVYIENMNKYGRNVPIKIMGSYEEWLTYIVSYKKDLEKNQKN